MSLKITVVTAVWNSEDTISDCLRSVDQQSYSNKEHIVVDGGSTDNTLGIVEEHLGSIDFFISEKDDGIYDALNKGIKLSSGDVIGFLHSDDIFKNDVVLEQIASAFEDPSVCAVYGDLDYVSRSKPECVIRRWRSSEFKDGDLQKGWMPPHPTLYIRRCWYDKIGFFDKNYRISGDYLSVLKLFSSRGFKSRYLPVIMVQMRLGGESNKSFSNVVKKTTEDLRAMRACGMGWLTALKTVVLKNARKINQFCSIW